MQDDIGHNPGRFIAISEKKLTNQKPTFYQTAKNSPKKEKKKKTVIIENDQNAITKEALKSHLYIW